MRFDFDNGETFKVDASELEISADIDYDLSTCSSLYYRASHFVALAKYELETHDAEYRQWRADSALKHPAQCSSEPKTKAFLESLPDFLAWKRKLAKYQQKVNQLEGLAKALEMKSVLLSGKVKTISSRTTQHLSREEQVRSDRERRDKARRAFGGD